MVDVYEAVGGPSGLICVPDWHGYEPTTDDVVEWARDVVPRIKPPFRGWRVRGQIGTMRGEKLCGFAGPVLVFPMNIVIRRSGTSRVI